MASLPHGRLLVYVASLPARQPRRPAKNSTCQGRKEKASFYKIGLRVWRRAYPAVLMPSTSARRKKSSGVKDAATQEVFLAPSNTRPQFLRAGLRFRVRRKS